MSTLIFDFDGTLADSLPLILKLFCELTNRPILPDAEIERLRVLPTTQLIRELKVPLWRVPVLLTKGRAAMAARMSEVPLFDGIPEVLAQLERDGHRMFIVSSNSVQNVEKFLKAHHLEHHFERVYGGAALTGKAIILRKIMRQNHIDSSEAFYIGDEVRDVDGAEKVGLRTVAVAWGLSGEQALAARKPYRLIRKASELPKMISIDGEKERQK